MLKLTSKEISKLVFRECIFIVKTLEWYQYKSVFNWKYQILVRQHQRF